MDEYYVDPRFSGTAKAVFDMSTLRGWWEEDQEKTQRFFETMLGHHGERAPYYCEPWVVREHSAPALTGYVGHLPTSGSAGE